jgi:peptide/nickel transport system substrate-binding protein
MKRYGILFAAIAIALATGAALAGRSGATHRASLSEAAARAGHTGGTLKLLYQGAFGSWDPQIDYTLEGWQLKQATVDGLLNFKKAQGTAAYTVVPDLAVAIPKPTDGGRTWVFHVRKGIRFSNGREVKPSDFLYTFQRIFKVHGPTASSFYGVLVGADACLKKTATCTLKGGVIADDKHWTVTFHLTRPDGEWLQKLAIPHASVVPAGTPNKDQGPKPIPSTGAYFMKSYDPNHQITLVRNPYFREWSKDAQPAGYPDTITERFDLTGEAAVTEVENNQADWIGYSIPSDRLNELATKYANQLYLNQLTANWYVPMNVNIPPFNNLDARRAVNYGVDRAAVIRLFGGPNLARPSCQILPAGFPGHKDYCPYTQNPGTHWTAPDMRKALRLAKASGTQGQKVAIVVQNTAVDKAVGTYMQSLLNQLGWKTSLKVLSSNIQFTYIQNTTNHVQISVTQWYQDYPGAADFLNVLFGCGSFHPGSDTSINIAGFCDRKIQKQMDTAIGLTAVNPTAGNKLWAKIDHEVTDASPAAVLFNPKNIDFVSKRVGNFVFSDQYYFIVDQAWVK